MINRRFLIAALASFIPACISLATSTKANADPIRVVASFSIIGDLVQEIGGENIALTTLVGANGDAHIYEPTPLDAKRMGQAQILFENGMSFESWLPRLVETSGFKGARVVVSKGVAPLAFSEHHAHHSHEDHDNVHHHHGSDNPHAWQDVANAIIYAHNIARALEELDPTHREFYQKRARAYISKLQTLDTKLKTTFSAVPESRRKVVTSHDAFGYFGSAYGIKFIAPEGISTEAEASAADVAKIIDQIRTDKVKAVFVENITSTQLTRQIALETGAKIGGHLYSDALAQPGKQASTYIGMMEWNADQLLKALSQ